MEEIKKQKFKKILEYIGWKVLGSLIFVLTVGTSLWAMAAFTEPTTGPAASVQDFAKNILGANNSDNSFDSSSVASNNNGSMIERLEYIQNNIPYVNWSDCEVKSNHLSTCQNSASISCSAGYALVDHNCTVEHCYLSDVNTLSMYESQTCNSYYVGTGDIKCCRIVSPN